MANSQDEISLSTLFVRNAGIVLIDGGYGNNTSLLKQLEDRKLKYIGGLAKNRLVSISKSSKLSGSIRLDQLVKELPSEAFSPVCLKGETELTVWVTNIEVEIAALSGSSAAGVCGDVKSPPCPARRIIAIIMNASSLEEADQIDYLITNVDGSKITPEWIVSTYSQRNWVEVFYREAKGWLGLKEYQVRSQSSLERHFILVFCAYTFILWHKLTGGFRRRWANRELNTFVESLEAFRTAMSFRFFSWLTENRDVFLAYKASLGFIWA